MKSFLKIGIGLFVVICLIAFGLKSTLSGWNIVPSLVIYGNIFLFGVTFLAFFLEIKGVNQANSHAFFRYVYMGMLLKFFLSVAAFLIFVFVDKEGLSRGLVFIWLLFYLIYTAVEVGTLVRAGKKPE